ncbi:protein Niban 1a [Alosa alosa]|uniref:protein Niban 1a n=1 Tax=Alosa alosa TaxID=278164 RepID=UPI0020151491|nr:protein Niban 1a [Alosa alosa]
MGISGSSLLDENKSNFIKGRAQQELDAFSVLYKQQYSVEYCNKIRDEMNQQEEQRTQLLKQREPLKDGEILYEEHVLYFDDTRKWRERYVVVRANYSLECHESYETFVKGVPARHKLLPTGGVVLTTEEKYMALVDQCFPDANHEKEDFAPPVIGMPGQFPVYLRLPYRRDSYFCFKQEARQTGFLAILNDCIRHQNQDFLKKGTVEVKAFLRALKQHRQHKGQYESWDMLIGSDARVLSNLLMEDLYPSLEKEMLPKLKAKKAKKRVWFATVEAAYLLIQGHLLEGLTTLKEACKTSASQQEVLLRSDMDQITSSKAFLQNKLTAMVTAPAERHCSEHVQPFLVSVLEELMEPVSSGFDEARLLGANTMEELCQAFQEGAEKDELKTALAGMSKANLQTCYQRVSSLQDQLKELQQRFNYTNVIGLVHSTQIDLQQLMENMSYTFELLLLKALDDNPENWALAMERAKNRVLKQYDYDSSTVRKRIFHQALMDITLPSMRRNLAPTVTHELPKFEQYIFADHAPFITVENVYEGILLQVLETEVSKVVKEAVSMKRYNLISELSREHFSQSSIYSLRSTPPGSTPGSPARVGSLLSRQPQPTSPLLGNGSEGSPCTSAPCSPVSEEEDESSPETKPDAAAASEQAEVGETLAPARVNPPAREGESPGTAGAGAAAAAAEQATSPVVESVNAMTKEPVAESVTPEHDAPVTTETAAVEIASAITEETVAATVVADVISSVSKEMAEVPPSAVTTETTADEGQAAVESSDTANTIATQTSFDIPALPATVSAPVTEAHVPDKLPEEAAVAAEPPSQVEVPEGSPTPVSPAPAEACVDPPAAAPENADTAEDSKADAEESPPSVTRETVALEMSVDATGENAVPESDPSLTSDPAVEVITASEPLPGDAEVELSVDAKPVAVKLGVEECIVVECIDDRSPVGVETLVDEVTVKPDDATEVTEIELVVDDGEAAADPSDTDEPQPEAGETQVEESVDAESAAPSAADRASAEVEERADVEAAPAGAADSRSAEVEECVDPKESGTEGTAPDRGTDQRTAPEEPAEPAGPEARDEAPSAGETANVMDSVKEIRDLIVEVIEVEEPVRHYSQSPSE